jgi:hypothetical protein
VVIPNVVTSSEEPKCIVSGVIAAVYILEQKDIEEVMQTMIIVESPMTVSRAPIHTAEQVTFLAPRPIAGILVGRQEKFSRLWVFLNFDISG